MILPIRPILSTCQMQLLDIIKSGEYSVYKTKTSYGVVVDGEKNTSLSTSLRSLLKRRLVAVQGGEINTIDELGWRKKSALECIDFDDIVFLNNIPYRVWDYANHSVYLHSNLSSQEDCSLILGRWIQKNKRDFETIIVYSKHEYDSLKHPKDKLSNRSKRYAKSPTRGLSFS